MAFNLDEETLREIVRGAVGKILAGNSGVQARVGSGSLRSVNFAGQHGYASRNGIFDDASKAAEAAWAAYRRLSEGGIAARAKVVEIVKNLVVAKSKEWGTFEFNETKIGKLEHKISKLEKVAYEAAKQCERANLPQIVPNKTLDDLAIDKSFDKIFIFSERWV